MNISDLFSFTPVSAVSSVAVTATGFELQQVNELLGNVVLILNGIFLIIGILKNAPIEKIKQINKKQKK